MHPDIIAALGTVEEVTAALGIETFLVGALVSELRAAQEGLPEPPRKTADADFAVKVRNWEEFRKLRTKLVDAGFKPHRSIEHRLLMGTAMVDLVPFGEGVQTGDAAIVWPESEFRMSVVGFEEACAEATSIDVPGGPTLRGVTVPGFFLLKVAAFMDRLPRGDPKWTSDADGIWYWLEEYAPVERDGRRFEVRELVGKEIEFPYTGGALLGLDVAKIAGEQATGIVRRFLAEQSIAYGKLVEHKAGILLGEDEFAQKRAECLGRLDAFSAGFARKG